MKKLMIALAAATTAMFSFGDFTSTGFENSPYVAGELLSTTNDDAGRTSIDGDFAATWVALPQDEDVQHTIKAFGTEGAEATPANYADAVGNNYLWVETTSSLLQRNVQPGGAAASIGDGIYLDTLVKFTPADKLFEASDITTGDKIAITYVGEDAAEVENPISNIVVYAGYVDGSAIVPTNYVMNLPNNADFDVNAWHRLTVRSIANVGSTDAPVGFAIYIDGNKEPLTYASDVAAGDSAYVGALNAAIQTYLYNGTKHALLPSLVNSGDNKTTITTVGFKGSGCVDNLAFTANPGFIEEGTAVEIAWDEGVATYTVVDSENNTLVDGAVTGGTAGSTKLLLEVGITYLTVTATYGTGYEAGTWTVTGDGAAISGGTFTVAEGAKLNIISMTPKFDVGGDHYGTFAEALAAAVDAGTSAEPATIQLLADADSALTFTEGYIILDLNGKTIQGGDLDTYSVVNSGATLTIIDSATGGTVVAPTFAEAEGAFYTDNGSTTINGGIFAATVYTEKMQNEQATGDIVVNAGSFYDPDYDPDDSTTKFYLTDYLGVDAGKPVYDAETQYFTLGGVEPAELTLTITDNANAESSVTINGEPAETGAVIEADDVIVITATAKSGYEYAQAPEGWTLSEGSITKTITVVDASVSVTIPAPAEVVTTFALTTTGGVNAEITTNPADVSALTQATDVTITATATNGFTYATVNLSGDWTYDSQADAISMTTNISENTTVVVPDAVSEDEPTYPSYIEGLVDGEAKTAYEKKYDAWKATYGADADSAFGAAFLLNIDPAAADQTLEPASITMEGGKIVISANQTLTAVNGKVYVKVATTLAGLASAEWTEATLNEGKVQVTPGSSDTAGFYKIKVDF